MREFALDIGATELVLVRHADAKPDDGDAQIDISYRNAPLSRRGREQAKAVAMRLASERIAAIYASPSVRTRETAEQIASAAGLTLATDERLREVHIGELERPLDPAATSIAQAVRDRLDSLAEIALREGSWSSIPGTEPAAEVRLRMRAAIDEIALANPGRRVAVVSHAGAINAYIADLLGLTREFFFPTGNTSISIVRARGSHRMLVGLNDTSHIRLAAQSL